MSKKPTNEMSESEFEAAVLLPTSTRPTEGMEPMQVNLDDAIKFTWIDDLGNMTRDFDLVPSPDTGRWYLWWRDKGTWIARFLNLASAIRVLSGTWDGTTGEPGWPHGDELPDDLDVVAALHRHHEKHGRFPQLELAFSSTIIELFTRIDPDLACAYLGYLMRVEEEAVAPVDAEEFNPLSAQHLATGNYGLDRRASTLWAPWFTRFLVRVYLDRDYDDKYGTGIPPVLEPQITAWLARIGRSELIARDVVLEE